MKIAISLIVLAAGLLMSPFVANAVVRVRPGETTEQATVRWVKRMVSGMVAMTTALLVMVAWQSDAIQDTHRALEVAEDAIEANCKAQRDDWGRTKLALEADVRLAETEHEVALAEYDDLVEQRANATPPDASGLPVEAQTFIGQLWLSALAAQDSRISAAGDVVALFADELATRRDTLAAHLAEPVSCPPPPLDDGASGVNLGE